MKYPDIKTIVDHIYHNYMTRCEIVCIQNKMVALDKEIVPWFDATLLYDVATDMNIAFETGEFVNITEQEVKPLMKQYDSEDIVELVDDYFFHDHKIIRITTDKHMSGSRHEHLKRIVADIKDSCERIVILWRMKRKNRSVDRSLARVKQLYKQKLAKQQQKDISQ